MYFCLSDLASEVRETVRYAGQSFSDNCKANDQTLKPSPCKETGLGSRPCPDQLLRFESDSTKSENRGSSNENVEVLQKSRRSIITRSSDVKSDHSVKVSYSVRNGLKKKNRTAPLDGDNKGDNRAKSKSNSSNASTIHIPNECDVQNERENHLSDTLLSTSNNSSGQNVKVSDINPEKQIRLPEKVSNAKTRALRKSKDKNSAISKAIVKGKKTSKGEYYCHDCEFTFKYISAFNKHKKDGACVFICPYCGKRYTARYYSNYQLHLKYHNNEKQHLCATCGKAFTEKAKLTIHLRTHSNERPYICDTCGRGFYTSMNLRCHIKHMHKERPKSFSCDLCDTKFVSVYNLNTHKKVTHSNARPFQCHICHKAFKTKYALEKKHMSFHDENGPLFYCTSCPKSFKKKDYLNHHMRRHKNERTHFCDVCGKGFYDMKTLREHVRTHSGEKPYHCPHCDYRCALKGNLSKHMKTHSDARSEEKEMSHVAMLEGSDKDLVIDGNDLQNPISNQRPPFLPESYPVLSLSYPGISRLQGTSSVSDCRSSPRDLPRGELLQSETDLSKKTELSSVLQNDLSKEQRLQNEVSRQENEFSNSLPMLPLLMRYDGFSPPDSQTGSNMEGGSFPRFEPVFCQNDTNSIQHGSFFDNVMNSYSFQLK